MFLSTEIMNDEWVFFKNILFFLLVKKQMGLRAHSFSVLKVEQAFERRILQMHKDLSQQGFRDDVGC